MMARISRYVICSFSLYLPLLLSLSLRVYRLEKQHIATLSLYDLMTFEAGLFPELLYESVNMGIRDMRRMPIILAYKLLSPYDSLETLKKFDFCPTENPFMWVQLMRKKAFLMMTNGARLWLSYTPKVCANLPCDSHVDTLRILQPMIHDFCRIASSALCRV